MKQTIYINKPIRIVTDQIGQEIAIAHYPRKIVSLVPSITALLAHLKLDKEVVGITKYCVKPKSWYRSKTRIGGTKKPRLNKIEQLKPDLIIANKEENVKEHIAAMQQFTPVFVSDIATLGNALEMILQIGILTNRVLEASALVGGIQDQAQKHLIRIDGKAVRRAAYFIWRKPWMVAGGDTFISSMMLHAGIKNIFADQARYPVVTREILQLHNPELVLLSSEPYPFKEKHKAELQSILPDADIRLVDGSYFSWYGSNLLKSFKYFKRAGLV